MNPLSAFVFACCRQLFVAGRWVVLTAGALLPLPGRGRIRVPAAQPLSLELISFTAAPQGADIRLDWVIEQTPLLAGFAIECSADGHSFKGLGVVPNRVNPGVCTYHWQDAACPNTGPNAWAYYRLRLLHLDRTETFSPVRAVQPAKAATAAPFVVFSPVLGDGRLSY